MVDFGELMQKVDEIKSLMSSRVRSIEEVTSQVSGLKKGFIGIAGVPGAGKTYLCDKMVEELRDKHGIKSLVIPMDGYHYYRKELDEMEDPAEAHARRGAAFTFDA